MPTESLRFPIGHFQKPDVITPQQIQRWIEEIAAFPEQLRKEVSNLSDEQLDTPYRPDGVKRITNAIVMKSSSPSWWPRFRRGQVGARKANSDFIFCF